MANAYTTTPTAAAVAAVLENFKKHLYGELNLSAPTIENYVGVVRRAAPVLGLTFTEAAARDYLAEMRQNGRQYSHLTITAVGLERYLQFIGRPVKLPRPSKPPRREIEPLSEFEVALILWHAVTLRQRAMLAVLAYSGVRNLELCSLEVRDVDIASQSIAVRNGKGGTARLVNIAGECVEVLAQYLRERGGGPRERLFVTVRHGLPLETQDLRKLVRAAARRAGLDHKRVFPHLFRHSLACNLVENGADLFTIQQQLGHRHLITTMEYLHPNVVRAATQYHAFAPRYSAGRQPRLVA